MEKEGRFFDIFLTMELLRCIFFMNTFIKRDIMPKKLDNIKERALEEARQILFQEGYLSLTVRRVAQALRIGVGTIYNYFPSKDHLIAGVMLEDWQEALRSFEAEGKGACAEDVVRRLFLRVQAFSARYQSVWTQAASQDTSASMRRRYHAVLVEQLGGHIAQALPKEREPWLAPFLAELVLRFGTDSRYEEIEQAVRKLLA